MFTRIAAAAAVMAAAASLGTPGALAAGPPQVGETWVTDLATTSVNSRAMVNPNGLATTARTEYITDDAYQANLAAQPPRDPFTGASSSVGSGTPLGAGTEPVEYLRRVAPLLPGTKYRYRVVATSSGATVAGATHFLTTRENASAFSLPDGRGWELVSPVDKNGGEVQGAGGVLGGGVLQAAADGGTVTYSSTFSFAGGVGDPGASQYLSRRGAGGWGTENVTLPTAAGAYGLDPDGVPYQLFSPELARGLVLVPERCEDAPCPRRYELRQSSSGALAPSPEEEDMAFAGASPDLAQVVLSTCAALTADAVAIPDLDGCDETKPNLYRWSGGALTLVNLLPAQSLGTPGAALAAQAGAVSPDGSRVYFTLAGGLYLRQGTGTFAVDAAQGGGGVFETASADGGVAFFTKAGHLYRYAAGGAATDLTPGGEVEGVLGASPDGAYVYYLTPAGLFLDHGGSATRVADDADPGNYPPATSSARVAANGNLAFVSSAPSSEFDNAGFAEAYLYSAAAATLTCVSCNPSGERPIGPAAIPGASANGSGPAATRAYKPRALSAAGNRLFFESRDALAGTDTNEDWDVYQWEAQGVGSCQRVGGCVALISSGRAAEGATFLDASADGDSAFFLTDGSLLASDPGAVDVYVARVGGGFPTPPTPLACVGDACQIVPKEPEDPAPTTGFYRAETNPPLSYAKAKKKGKKHGKAHKKKRGKRKAKGKAGAKRGGRR